MDNPTSQECDIEDTPSKPGYYRDNDDIGYVSSTGAIYYLGPDTMKPTWRKYGFLSPDAEPTTLDPGYLELCEKTRIAYGIPA
jgi:hypothetical protein